MKTTYNEILNSMQTAFFNECGENVEPLSDLGARFKAVASELFSLSCYGDYILRQSFPQTATGNYLDFHAQLRGIARKSETKAKGKLTFSILNPIESDTYIPLSTLCAVKDSPYIQFSTVETAVIPAGETSVTVNAIAISCGDEYNVAAREVTVMVNPPMGVATVTNNFAFSGGYHGESDTELRKRILAAYSIPPKGMSIEMLRSAVLDNDDILDCNIVNNSSYIDVYVKTKDSVITSEIVNRIKDMLAILRLFSIDINVYHATEKDFDIYIEVCGEKSAEKQIRQIVGDYAGGIGIGENVKINQFISAVASLDSVKYCDISSNIAEGGIIPCNPNEYPRLVNIEVSYVE